MTSSHFNKKLLTKPVPVPKQDMMNSSSKQGQSRGNNSGQSTASNMGNTAHIPGLPLFILDPSKAQKSSEHFYSVGSPITYGNIEPTSRPTRTIYRFQDSNIQDPLAWSKEFRRIATINGWPNENALVILEDLVSDQYYQKLQGKKAWTGKLDLFSEVFFPSKDFNLYRSALKLVKRNTFTSFDAYFNKLSDIRKRADLCSKHHGNTIANQDLIDTIVAALSKEERLFLASQNIMDLDGIVEGMSLFQDTQRFYRIQENETHDRKPKEKSQVSKKFCTFHEVPTHDTSECRILQAQKEHVHQKPNQPCSVVKIEPNTVNLPTLDFKTASGSIRLIVDTKASRNFINYTTLKKLNLLDSIESASETVSLANGQDIPITSRIHLQGTLSKHSNTEEMEFLVLPTLPYEGIIGLQTLGKVGCQLKVTNNNLAVEVYDQEKNESPDTILLNKLDCLYLNDTDFQCKLSKARAKNPKLGLIKTTPISINLVDNTPICQRPYSISLPRLAATKAEIQRLLDLKIIRKSNSAYASPAFPVPKKNNQVRLVCDYKRINDKTVKHPYPFPVMQNMFLDLKGARYFSQLDLNMGYHQIPLAEDAIPKTAFVTIFGHFEYLRLPFGLSNAPQIFQKTMNDILEHFPFVKVFVDDILIFSPDKESHKDHVLQVVNYLIDNGISINFEKSSFLKEEVTYLGKIINKDGLRSELNGLDNIEKLLRPKSKTELRKLLGKLNWFRDHVPGLSKLLLNITNQLKDSNPNQVEWTQKDDDQVEEILKLIRKQIVLHYPDPSKGYVLKTDASDLGFGAVLLQEGKLIGIYSNKLQGAELRYTTTEKKLLAVIKALKRFKSIVFGAPITVLTDHKNLTYVTSCENNRAQRWKLLLDEYNVTIKYLPGNENHEADMLSRCYMISNKSTTDNVKSVAITTILRKLQLVSSKIDPKKYEVSREEETSAIRRLHKWYGHPGNTKLLNTLKPVLRIDCLADKIKLVTASCKACQLQKRNNQRVGLFHGEITASKPFSRISIDLYGPIDTDPFKTESPHQKIMLLVVVDIYSRWTRIIKTASISARTMIKLFKKALVRKVWRARRTTLRSGKAVCGGEIY
jgi:hypothetical protein